MYYMIGIKGSGMASLAMILHQLGYEVMGSDYEDHYFTQDPLEQAGIVMLPFSASHLKQGMEVIVGNAFDQDHEEVKEAKRLGLKMYTYHEFLGHLMDQKIGISIAGTHGKTTTTTMVYEALHETCPSICLIGDGTGIVQEHAQYFILESCEYRHHFLAYRPHYAIITNIELDHVDYYHKMEDYVDAYRQFADQVKELIIVCGDDMYLKTLKTKTKMFTYGVGEHNDYRATDIIEDASGVTFTLMFNGQYVERLSLPLFGHHMLLNALGVLALAHQLKQDVHVAALSLSHFKGAKRRFAISLQNDDVYIDDYAHHPTAVRVTIEAARKKYPNKEIVAIYKPHRYSRMYHFVDEFADALGQADYVYLCPFPIHQPKDPGVDIDIYYLANRLPGSVVLSEDIEGAKILAKHNGVVYVFMSSKDIYHLADFVKEVKR